MCHITSPFYILVQIMRFISLISLYSGLCNLAMLKKRVQVAHQISVTLRCKISHFEVNIESLILWRISTPKCFQDITLVDSMLSNKTFMDQTTASVCTNTLFCRERLCCAFCHLLPLLIHASSLPNHPSHS